MSKRAIEDINEWLADLCSDNNKCEPILNTEWAVVRMSGLIPLQSYIDAMGNNYDLSVDDLDIPDDAAYVLAVGVQDWVSDQPEVNCCMAGNTFFLGSDLNMLDDIEDVFGGGPELCDSTMKECSDWIKKCGATIVVTYDHLHAPDGTELPLFDMTE